MYVADPGFGSLRRSPRDPVLRAVPGFSGAWRPCPSCRRSRVFGAASESTFVRSKVINGTAAPTAVPMSAAQQAAVGAFVDDVGHPFCTGTLITSHIVLSAAHCGVRVGDRFVLGSDAAAPSAVAYASETIRDPRWASATYDHLLTRLDRDLPVEPLPLSPTVPAVGEIVQGAGYGMVDPEASNNTQRWWTAEPVVVVSDRWIAIDGQGQHGLCLGDSGGPLLVAGPAIVGTVSQGAASCVGEDIYSRPDPAWVAGVVAGWATVGATPPTPLRAWLPVAVAVVGTGVAVAFIVAAIWGRR